MRSRFRRHIKALLAGLALAFIIVPLAAQAQEVPFPYYGGLNGPSLLPCTGFIKISQKNVPYQDPQTGATSTRDVNFSAVSDAALNGLKQCESLCDVIVFINRLLILVMSVLVTIFTPIMILLGGFYILTSGGNPGKRTTGKNIIQGTLIGLVITLCSFFIVNQALLVIFKGGWGNALKAEYEQQVSQGVNLGSSQAPEFQWNSITCTPTQGGVNITPPKSAPVKTNTTPTNASPTTQQTPSTILIPTTSNPSNKPLCPGNCVAVASLCGVRGSDASYSCLIPSNVCCK